MSDPAFVLQQHADSYQAAMARQHEQALQLLTQQPPDFSQAATACHRALQFQRQGEALQEVLRELRPS